MKSRELLKLNERQSIVEIEKGNETEYCVCSYYDDNKPEGSKWTWGHYFFSLEDAIKYAATECFSPMYKYQVIECYSGSIDSTEFYTYDKAQQHLEDRYKKLSSEEDCVFHEIYEDCNGNLVAHVEYEENEFNDFKLIKIKM